MANSFKTKMLLTASALTIGAFGVVPNALAQDEERSAIDVLTDEIVVTATKKAGGENVQDTNIAISAFGADQLEAFQVRNISDLSFKAPNVQLDEVGTVKGTANFSIRGLGVNSSIPSIDPAVGVFVDGVYLGVNTGVVFDTFDIDSVEVLRGPQGVLFGRNVTGGAVLLNTGNPTDEFTAKVKGTAESGLIGTGGNYTIQGVVSGPLGGGLKAKLGAYYNNDRGFHENLFDPALVAGTPFAFVASPAAIAANDLENSNFGLSETYIIRGALEYDGREGLNLLAKFEYGDSVGDGPAAQSSINGSGVGSFATNLLGLPSQSFDRDTFDFAVNTRGFQDTEWVQFSFKTDLDVAFGDGTITNIFGYRDFDQTASSDIDASILPIFDANVGIAQEQISNEIRYNGRFFDDRLDFTAGFFYFSQDINYSEQRRVFSAAAGAILNIDGGGIQDTETYGIFAAGEYDVTDRFSINAGLRYSDETKEADIALIQFLGGPSCVVEGTSIPGDQACVLDEFPTFSTNNLSPKVGVGFEALDNLRFYAHWARAFRAGGFNLRNTAADVTDPLQSPGPFQDERLDSFEIGFKSEPIPGARINAAFFFNTIDDLQREINLAGGPAVVQQVITNAADAEIYGFEVDAIWPLTDNFLVNGSIGVVESNLTDIFVNLLAPTPAELSTTVPDAAFDLEIPRLAPFTASAGFTYFQDFGFGNVTFNGNYARRDQTFFTDNNLGFIPAQDRIDASIQYDVPNTGVNLTVYGKNLLDDVIFGGDTQLSNGTFSPLGKGRVFGVEITVEY